MVQEHFPQILFLALISESKNGSYITPFKEAAPHRAQKGEIPTQLISLPSSTPALLHSTAKNKFSPMAQDRGSP